MAGRGVTIRIQVLRGAETHEISLPVALHSPLEVLRDQLESLTNIHLHDQVLILCNLSDAERNSDVLLSGRDHMSLRDCGIRNNSVLTLHALGQQAQNGMSMEAIVNSARSVPAPSDSVNNSNGSNKNCSSSAGAASAAVSARSPRGHPTSPRSARSNSSSSPRSPREVDVFESSPYHSVETRIDAAHADHSYNGIIFDVISLGPYEVELNSISIGGMLGRTRIYVRDRPWSVDNDDTAPSTNWWAHSEALSRKGWRCVFDKTLLPSWDRHLELVFDEPVVILPHSRHGIYCHSSLPDDLGTMSPAIWFCAETLIFV
jgi:hypothetical protein